MNILSDKEYRIFLSAMSREKETCKSLDACEDNGIKLVPICKSIVRKVNDAIPKTTFDQVRAERNIAVSQLEEVGKQLGEKMDGVITEDLIKKMIEEIEERVAVLEQFKEMFNDYSNEAIEKPSHSKVNECEAQIKIVTEVIGIIKKHTGVE